MQRFFMHWLVVAVALAITARVLPGIHLDSATALLVGAVVLGFLNAVLKPVLVILTLPLTLVTLGLFYFVLNAIVFSFGAYLVPGFEVDGFGWGLLGALLLGFISSVLGAMLRSGTKQPRLG